MGHSGSVSRDNVGGQKYAFYGCFTNSNCCHTTVVQGKSTLLNILAGRLQSTPNAHVSHEIKLNGTHMTPSDANIRRKIAFVAQTDTLNLNATPRECIRFSARLRLARDASDEEVEALTTRILKDLNLDRVADSRIKSGSNHGGLSGGEMRRTSLGIELVTCPSIVILDEVTSGLDSHNAMAVSCRQFQLICMYNYKLLTNTDGTA